MFIPKLYCVLITLLQSTLSSQFNVFLTKTIWKEKHFELLHIHKSHEDCIVRHSVDQLHVSKYYYKFSDHESHLD